MGGLTHSGAPYTQGPRELPTDPTNTVNSKSRRAGLSLLPPAPRPAAASAPAPAAPPTSTMVRCHLRSPSPQQGSGRQGESERLHQAQELRPEDVPIYGRTQRPYRDRQGPQAGGLCSAGTPPCLKAPQAHPHPDSPDGPVTRTFSKRLQKDREEEKMHKAAPSLPGPTRKSHLPGSTSRDHSKSPSDAQAPSLQGTHKILSKMSKSHLPNKA